jgi:hypothetical protein
MGMTIKKAKAIVKGITDKIDCNTVDIDDWAEFWGFTREEYEEFLDMSIKAITTMRKYQKIHEIVKSWKSDTWTDGVSYDCMVQISEVLEDG